MKPAAPAKPADASARSPWWKGLLSWKVLTATVLAIFFVFPQSYDWVVRHLLYPSYYQLAFIMEPPDWKSMKVSADVPTLDNAPKAVRLERAIALAGDVARLKRDDYKPGRSSASGASRENSGKVWTGAQCLFVSSVELVTLQVSADGGDGEMRRMSEVADTHDPAFGYLDISGDRLKALARAAGQTPVTMLREQLAGYAGRSHVPFSNCDVLSKTSKAGALLCPRIAIWARGSPAPCSIWPF